MNFMSDNFILRTETARTLYEHYTSKMPIIDYHCHIDPREIAENKRFSSITEAWLYADHYKWRAIRACGFPEKLVTGPASDEERFRAWASTMPRLVGNPLYAWTHLELKTYFGITEPLSEKNADAIYKECGEKLKNGLSVHDILKMSNVRLLCTTDDPADDLRWHKVIRESDLETKVLPAFRPDKGVNIENDGFAAYIREKLSPAAGMTITRLDELLCAYTARLDYFEENGCKTTDHGMNEIPFRPASSEEVDAIFRKALAGEVLSADECAAYKTYLLVFFAHEIRRRGWVMQLHYGVIRNNSEKNFAALGPDTGFDTIAGSSSTGNLLSLLNAFEKADALPKMVLYSLNPNDNAAIDALCGCFQGNDEGIRSKIQHGAAWWFNDHLDGMRDQLRLYAATGVLANFIGMLTDSRSFLSYTRHDYFRRILCDYIGSLIEEGQYPADLETAGQIVADISYGNAKRFFGFVID